MSLKPKHASLQFTDMLALCGDASDNVPGVRGIGPKTAAPLLQQFGDVEGVLTAAAEVQLVFRVLHELRHNAVTAAVQT